MELNFEWDQEDDECYQLRNFTMRMKAGDSDVSIPVQIKMNGLISERDLPQLLKNIAVVLEKRSADISTLIDEAISKDSFSAVGRHATRDLRRLFSPAVLSALESVEGDFMTFLPPALVDWMKGISKVVSELEEDVKRLKGL